MTELSKKSEMQQSCETTVMPRYILETNTYGAQKYLSKTEKGFFSTDIKKEAEIFDSLELAMETKNTLINKMDFFFVVLE